MKKFDLEAAKAGAPVCTRDGRPARIVCFDVVDKRYNILALIMRRNGETAEYYTNDGKYNVSYSECEEDLFMASTQHTGYVAMYRTEEGMLKAGPYVYGNRESAVDDTKGWTSLLAVCEVTWED